MENHNHCHEPARAVLYVLQQCRAVKLQPVLVLHNSVALRSYSLCWCYTAAVQHYIYYRLADAVPVPRAGGRGCYDKGWAGAG